MINCHALIVMLVMHSKSDKIEIIINDKADEVTEELFQSFLSRYHIGWKHE